MSILTTNISRKRKSSILLLDNTKDSYLPVANVKKRANNVSIDLIEDKQNSINILLEDKPVDNSSKIQATIQDSADDIVLRRRLLAYNTEHICKNKYARIIERDVNGYAKVAQIGSKTFTYQRNSDNYITSWTTNG